MNLIDVFHKAGRVIPKIKALNLSKIALSIRLPHFDGGLWAISAEE